MSNANAANFRRTVKRKKRKGKGGTIAILIILALVLGAAALMYFNQFYVRDRVFDFLRDVPLIGRIIPEGEYGAGVVVLSPQETILQNQVNAMAVQTGNLQAQLEALRVENERLRDFERQQEQFAIDRELFVQYGISADPMAFWRIFQQINPELADHLMQEAAGVAVNQREVRSYLVMLGGMEARAIAAALDNLILTDVDLVAGILNGLAPDLASMVLESMNVDNRVNILRYMRPEGF